MRLSFVFLPLVAVVGCGGSADLPELADVTGTVTLDGAPLANANVIFVPSGGGRSSTGFTDSQGKYSLRFSAGNTGAVIGSHQVKVTVESEPEIPAGADPDNMSKSQMRKYEASMVQLPPQYNETSELTAEVKAGEDNVCDFPLQGGLVSGQSSDMGEAGGAGAP